MNPETKVLELATLYEISKVLTSTLDLKKSLNSVMNILDKFLDMKYGTVILSNPKTQELSPFFSFGIREEELKIYKIGEGIIGKVYKTGSPMFIPDVANEPGFMDQVRLSSEDQRVSYVCVPVESRERVIGVLSIAFYQKKVPFSIEGGFNILTMVASLIGQTIELYRMIDKEREILVEEKTILQQELKKKHSLENVIGQSNLMKEVSDTVHRVAASTAAVFIRGESGTGKELIARAIHYNSPRAKGHFIKINCTALPETLLESVLFGHERGSFTGATHERKGRFELADGGTIFLDEIGDIPVSIQMKLLRVLQDKKFERLGSSKTISVDVRVLAATNKDLEKAVAEASFREDLYYRLNVIPIFLPPLRKRKEDIPVLAAHFLEKFNKENRRMVRVSDDAMDLMLEYSWPGNVRQLENCIERLVIMADKDDVNVDELPYEVVAFGRVLTNQKPESGNKTEIKHTSKNVSLSSTIEEMERARIVEALGKCGWLKSRAASLLGITPRQLAYWIEKYAIAEQKPWEQG